jgi:hypothetical protein
MRRVRFTAHVASRAPRHPKFCLSCARALMGAFIIQDGCRSPSPAARIRAALGDGSTDPSGMTNTHHDYQIEPASVKRRNPRHNRGFLL